MKRKGFTLIELLVTVSLIGLLYSIVLVVVIGVREKARMAGIISFASQVDQALMADCLVAMDFNESNLSSSNLPVDHCSGSAVAATGNISSDILGINESKGLKLDGSSALLVTPKEKPVKGITISVWVKTGEKDVARYISNWLDVDKQGFVFIYLNALNELIADIGSAGASYGLKADGIGLRDGKMASCSVFV